MPRKLRWDGQEAPYLWVEWPMWADARKKKKFPLPTFAGQTVQMVVRGREQYLRVKYDADQLALAVAVLRSIGCKYAEDFRLIAHEWQHAQALLRPEPAKQATQEALL